MNYRIEEKLIIDGTITIHGWVIPTPTDSHVEFYIKDLNGNNIDFSIKKIKRNDVARVYLNELDDKYDLGFNIEFNYKFNTDETYNFFIVSNGEKIIEKINKKIIANFKKANISLINKIVNSFNSATIKNAYNFLKKHGIKEFIKKIKNKLNATNNEYQYLEWYNLTKVSDEEIKSELNSNSLTFRPKFSLIIPIFDTEDKFLYLLFKSILNQSYQNFEICVADATNYTTNKNNPRNFFDNLINKNTYDINKYNYDYKNIHIKYLSENKSIADNTNAAISMATGDYIVLIDHDDELTQDALYEVAKAIDSNINIEFIYSDEDKVDKFDDYYFDPNFKSDFNLDMLLSVNYICHLSVVKKDLLDELLKQDGNYELPKFNGAQDYNLFLRIVNYIINKSYKDGRYDVNSIYHIRKVLYHWRWHEKSTAKNFSSKLYAFDNGAKAVEDFYKNTKINFPKIDRVEKGYDYGIYHTIYSKDYAEPLISIIIPTKDHVDDLDLTINSVINGNYKNIEFIICENNSTDKSTFEYYDSIRNNKNIKIVTYDGDFNYSKINNYAYKYASGNYILFLNNDVEMIEKDSLHEMLSYIKRDDVGAVGAKLLYNDKTYQHAGVVIGIGGVADNIFKGISIYEHTYMNRAELVTDYSAVTAACLMTKREVFDSVNGFDEKLEVAFNDIDLCLRIREKEYLIVYNPYSSFFHFESKSRGYEDTSEKIKRFNGEFAFFAKRWEKQLLSTDKYYNPNLTLRSNDFKLRNLKYEKIGEPFPLPDEIKLLIEENY